MNQMAAEFARIFLVRDPIEEEDEKAIYDRYERWVGLAGLTPMSRRGLSISLTRAGYGRNFKGRREGVALRES